ncbi:MAG: antibiotic biosynthesis monooxygenase [Desulfovibrio sp.]|nr:antibiotic biosynthesis monooxygenase [Desulfovibrio sp.]
MVLSRRTAMKALAMMGLGHSRENVSGSRGSMKRALIVGLIAVSLFLLPAAQGHAAEEQPLVRMAYITVKPGLQDAFIAAVTEGMRTSVRTEPGVLALYCVADKRNPDALIFFEMYTSEQAYQAHRATSHFKKYIETTKDMSLAKSLLETVPVELQDKWR